MLKCGILGSWGGEGGMSQFSPPGPGPFCSPAQPSPTQVGISRPCPGYLKTQLTSGGGGGGGDPVVRGHPARTGPPSSHTPKVRFPATGAGGTSVLSNCKDLTRSPGQPGSSNTSRKPRTQVERIRCDRWCSASLLLTVPLERGAIRSPLAASGTHRTVACTPCPPEGEGTAGGPKTQCPV